MATRAQKAEATRTRILDVARTLFADRGFYGASVGQVALELAMTKQGVLHYFPSKEKLYAEVLRLLSIELESALDRAIDRTLGADPSDTLMETLAFLIPREPKEIDRSRLLMRELLDNRNRALETDHWYLAGFLERLTSMLKACDGWGDVADAEARVAIFQWLGAIEYSIVARPTLRGLYAEKGSKEFWDRFENRFRAMVASDRVARFR